jgi:putative thioredoxin
MSHEIADFETDVLERSRSTPVLVDFWAEWCGPCRTLGPVLEKLADSAGDDWVLAKVDVDQNQAVAQNYQVQGIPAVKLFIDGQVVAEFTGVLPEGQVRSWLEENLPDESKVQFADAMALLQAGDTDGAVAALQEIVRAEDPGGPASVSLAQVTMFEDPQGALDGVAPVRLDSDFIEAANDVRAIAGLLARNADDFAEHAVRADYLTGIEALRVRDFAGALEHLIAVLGRNKSYDDSGARKACIAVFNYLGRDHSLAETYRRRFQSALN